MRAKKHTMWRATRLRLAMLLIAIAASAASPQAAPDFSGLWKQDNDHSVPRRKGDVTLRIEHRGAQLTIETTISCPPAAPRGAVQKYTLGGNATVSTGADGDEFHTSVVWKDRSLVFSIEEHEDGGILRSQEMWTVLDNGATLERIREREHGDRQTLLYRRVPEKAGGTNGKQLR